MGRVVKEKEYTEKRKEILDVALRLVLIKGYEQMSIQDILAELRISKGAFYHYFASKPELLEALIERISDEVEELLKPIVYNQHLSARDKFLNYFDLIARWKSNQKSFLIALLRGWYTDDNAIVRQKVQMSGMKRLAPLLTTIIHQGIEEKIFSTSYPAYSGEVVMSLLQSASDTCGRVILNEENPLPHLEGTLAAYTDAIERVLGATCGSLSLFDPEMLKEWVI